MSTTKTFREHSQTTVVFDNVLFVGVWSHCMMLYTTNECSDPKTIFNRLELVPARTQSLRRLSKIRSCKDEMKCNREWEDSGLLIEFIR